MDRKEIVRRLGNARSATLGTVDAGGRPHLVPIVFAYDEGRLYTAVDRKPKSTFRLKRLRNIEANPDVSVLVDHYDDDWTALWWVRIDGTASVIGFGPRPSQGPCPAHPKNTRPTPPSRLQDRSSRCESRTSAPGRPHDRLGIRTIPSRVRGVPCSC